MPKTNSLHFILGGTRSGKSTHAEKLCAGLAAKADGRVLYVATAKTEEYAMQDRVARHRFMRPKHWTTLEAPHQVAQAIAKAQAQDPHPVVLVECMTLLACNVIMQIPGAQLSSANFEAALEEEVLPLLEACRADRAHWVFVSSETGLGGMGHTPLTCAYGDGLGRANQRLAAAADAVTFMVAGIPWPIKP